MLDTDIRIHTLNARESIFWETMQDLLHLSTATLHDSLIEQYRSLLEELNLKNIDYLQLQSPLIPQTDRYDLCLFFDTSKIDDSFYAKAIFDRVIPLLPNDLCCTVTCGDLIGDNRSQEAIYAMMCDSVTVLNETTYENSTQYFLVYINNLTKKMLTDIVDSLTEFDPCVGFIDCSNDSKLKTYFSTHIGQLFLKYKNVAIINGIEDEITKENINNTMIDFKRFGFEVRSISNVNYTTFLTYKIERGILPSYERDPIIGLAAISPESMSNHSQKIFIADEKFEYLLKEKIGSLSRFGTCKEDGVNHLKQIISAKIRSNYFFNLHFMRVHGVSKFNIIIEIPSTISGKIEKYLVSLRMNYADDRIELVTMY